MPRASSHGSRCNYLAHSCRDDAADDTPQGHGVVPDENCRRDNRRDRPFGAGVYMMQERRGCSRLQRYPRDAAVSARIRLAPTGSLRAA